jgi:hypothetical protein
VDLRAGAGRGGGREEAEEDGEEDAASTIEILFPTKKLNSRRIHSQRAILNFIPGPQG